MKTNDQQHTPHPKRTRTKKKFVSIQRKLVIKNTIYMSSLTLCMMFMFFFATSKLTQDTLELSMKQLAVNASYTLSNQVYLHTHCMNGISENPAFADPKKK